jgi:hypothetical protein
VKYRIMAAVLVVAGTLVTGASARTAGSGCSAYAHPGTLTLDQIIARCSIGHASAAGDYATATAGGTVKRPVSLSAVVKTRRHQAVDVSWSMTCGRGFGAGSKSGSFKRSTTSIAWGWSGYLAMKQLRMPMTSPDDCTAAATAQIGGSDRLNVWIIATYR